jgi:hypothetical protein
MSGRVLVTTRRSADYASDAFLELLDDVALASLLQLGPVDVSKVDKAAFSPNGWTRFTEAMLRLNTANRIIRCADVAPKCAFAAAAACPHELSHSTVVVGHAPASAIDLRDYLTDVRRVAVREQDLSYRARISEGDFAVLVFDQFFRYARELKLIDRALGQYWAANAIYRDTLQWFVTEANARGVRDIALVTAFHYGNMANEPLVHAECVRLGIRLETKVYPRFPHWRAIISDRFTLVVDHGLDLRLGNGLVRETEMHVKGIADASMSFVKALRIAPRNSACTQC